LVLDGAMGTSLHSCDCDLERDYLGKENCSEILVQTRPDVVQGIHESFLEAGADAVETNTFGAGALVLAEFDLADQTRALNRQAAEIARAACERHSSADKPRFALGSIGPGTKLLTLGHTDWDAMLRSYTEQVRGLLDGGVDALLIETCQDILQVKCALCACLDALAERGRSPEDVPLLVSVTIETTGTMLLGTEIAAAATALASYPIASLGLNCATGPGEMAEHIRFLSRRWDRHISVVPNAGLPALVDGRTVYPLAPEPFAEALERYVEEEGVSIVGGCCGTTPEHIRLLAERVGGRRRAARAVEPLAPGTASLYSPVEHRQEASSLLVGERTNTNGSRKFKRLLSEEDWEGVVSMARELVREGSHVLDVCVDFVGRDGPRDMAEVVSRLASQVQAPLMIDSTEPEVIEAGLQRAPGKAIINSANLEEGEAKFGRLCAMARRYGAAIVLGTIDEDPEEAMAKTAERKLAIAQRMFRLATEEHGLAPADLFFDPLVLPITTGVEADRRLALETIEGTRRIAEALPECQIIVGLSNVSFGLSPAARVVLNSVFLHELEQAGLTAAIVHVSKILPRSRIDEERWQAALDLLYDRRREGFDPLTRFIELFEGDEDVAGADAGPALADLPLEERLRQHIIEGEQQGLAETLDEALTKYSPLDIINDHLLEGMKVVGERFGAGQMQLPFVLQSAQVMKAAVAHLEPHMEKSSDASKGRIVLATVQGDVHDIGKNLVDIILTNNGYEVINLGIKQPLANIIRAFEEHQADAIGLSGLLVKSVGVMQSNLEELRRLKWSAPVILGGAALNRHYAERDLRSVYPRTYYGRDAFEGLRFMDLLSQGRLEELDREIEQRLAKRDAVDQRVAASAKAQEGGSVAVAPVRSDVAADVDIPTPPFFGTRVVHDVPLEEIYPYVNTVA
ncbi:MAG: methionine synthase, partial [Planctomycetota bacterium]